MVETSGMQDIKLSLTRYAFLPTFLAGKEVPCLECEPAHLTLCEMKGKQAYAP